MSHPQKQSGQRLITHLAAPMAMDRGVEGSALGQKVGAEKVVAWAEDAAVAAGRLRVAVHADLHLPFQNEHPLRRASAMELAAKAHRAAAQLVTAAGKHLGQHSRRLTLVQGNGFFFETRPAVGAGVQNGLLEYGKRVEGHGGAGAKFGSLFNCLQISLPRKVQLKPSNLEY